MIRDLSLVFPVYNEEGNIPDLLSDIDSLFVEWGQRLHVVFVNDGSSDGSLAMLRGYALERENVRIVENSTRLGCHPSELVGLGACSTDCAIFLPSDRQIRCMDIGAILDALEWDDVVFSYRVTREDSMKRRMTSVIWNRLNRWLFHIKVRDLDSAHGFSSRGVKCVVENCSSTSTFLTTEMYLAAEASGCRIGEAPIRHYPREAGSATAVSIREIGRTFYELLRYRSQVGRLRHSEATKVQRCA